MLARVDLIYGLSYAAIGADNIGDAFRILSVGRIARAVSHAYFSFCVAQQAEGKIELLGESAIFFYSIKAHAKYLSLFIGILLDSVAEPDAFGGAAGRVCLWIKPQDYCSASKIAQSNIFASMRLRGELRRLVSYIQHSLFSFLAEDCTRSAPLMLQAKRAEIFGAHKIFDVYKISDFRKRASVK
jgi:hypothetical protein